MSLPHYIHSEWLAGILCLVMCQGCTEEKNCVRGRDGFQRSYRPVYSKLLSGLHCVPLYLGLSGGPEDSLVPAKVMSTQRHMNTHCTWSHVAVIVYVGTKEST